MAADLCLPQDVSKRATAAQILKHEWLVKEGVALDIALDSVVLKRLKQFAQMNKLKKACLMVIGQHLTPDEIAGRSTRLADWANALAGVSVVRGGGCCGRAHTSAGDKKLSCCYLLHYLPCQGTYVTQRHTVGLPR